MTFPSTLKADQFLILIAIYRRNHLSCNCYAHVIGVICGALEEAVEEGIVSEILQLSLSLQVALSFLRTELVDGVVGVDHLGVDRNEGLRPRLQREPELHQLGDLDGGVEQGL